MKAQLLTFNEACEFLRITKGTLHKLIRKKDIPAFRVGNLWRIDKGELIHWLRRQQGYKKEIEASLSSNK